MYRKFLFGEQRASVRSIYDASTPFGYFPAKQANQVAVQLNRIDYVERQKRQTDSGETKHNGIKFESHRAARGRERLRRQLENGQRKISYSANRIPIRISWGQICAGTDQRAPLLRRKSLHRAIIDTSPVNRVVRKFWKTANDGLGLKLIVYSAVYHFFINTLL